MNGYEYLVVRNRLTQQLGEEIARLAQLPVAECEAETRRVEAKFDVELAELYAKVAGEFPGERKRKARPIVDPR